jgi:hypothetical protein
MDGFTWGTKSGVEFLIERVGESGPPGTPAVVALAKALREWIVDVR